MNYAHLDVLSVLMAGMGLDPSPVLDRYSPIAMQEYREDYSLYDSISYLAEVYHRQGIPFDAIAEKMAGIAKSTFYRRLKAQGNTIDGLVVGNEYLDTMKFLASGLKHASAEYKPTDKRLDQFLSEPYEHPVNQAMELHDAIQEVEEVEVQKEEGDSDVGFTF